MSENITINGNDYDPEVVSAGVSLFRGAMSENARGIQPNLGSGLGGADPLAYAPCLATNGSNVRGPTHP